MPPGPFRALRRTARTALLGAGLCLGGGLPGSPSAALLDLVEPRRPVPQQTLAERAAPLAFRADLYRAGAALRPLPQRAPIPAGDDVCIEIQGPQVAYLYVVAESADGDLALLFPSADPECAPLSAPLSRHFPRRASSAFLTWPVTRASGLTTFLVLESRDPLPVFEREIRMAALAASNPALAYTPLEPRVLDALPLPAGSALAAARPGERLTALAIRLPPRARREAGLWLAVLRARMVER